MSSSSGSQTKGTAPTRAPSPISAVSSVRGEAGVHADIDVDVGDVPREPSCFFPTSDAERNQDCGIAIDPAFDVVARFAVSHRDAHRHLTKVPTAPLASVLARRRARDRGFLLALVSNDVGNDEDALAIHVACLRIEQLVPRAGILTCAP
jgi:hypothetical protein